MRPVRIYDKRPRREIDLRNGSETYVGSQTQGLSTHVVHELRSLYALGKTWVVFHQRCGGKLAAGLQPFVKHGRKTCSGCIYGGRISRRAASYYKALDIFHKSSSFPIFAQTGYVCKDT